MSSCPLRVQVADRIVAQRSEVDDRIEPREIRRCHVPEILHDGRNCAGIGDDRALAEITDIETDDVIPETRDVGRHHGADVAVMTRDQNAFEVWHRVLASAA